MVGKRVYIAVKADELLVGDRYCFWAVMDDGRYPAPRQIVEIKKPSIGKLGLKLDDGDWVEVYPSHVVVIQDMA